MSTLTRFVSARRILGWIAGVAFLALSPTAFAEEPDPIAKVAERAVAQYSTRLEAATKELNATRDRIVAEKGPLLEAAKVAEDRIVAIEPEIASLQTAAADSETRKKQLQMDRFGLQKNFNYMGGLARDSLKSVGDELLPGEPKDLAERVEALTAKLDLSSEKLGPEASAETAEFLLDRVLSQLGGRKVAGESLVGEGNKLVPGTFAFAGPEVLFQSRDGTTAGTVRLRDGSNYPITYPIASWDVAHAGAYFQGQQGTIMVDASGGKALRLRQTTGSVFEHINRGGPVAYLIICVGLFALGLALFKVWELRGLKVDSPARVQAELATFFAANEKGRREALDRLHGATRELFATGQKYLNQPKEALEEHLFAFTLRTRLHYERRLPLLAVIATASPLLGLLGTVMGMIKTFALITVFGTGNAAKLSSGISEVLVTTELGLTVAIPSLIAHGFLSQRAHRKLSLLERYAVEFSAAAGDARGAEPVRENLPSL